MLYFFIFSPQNYIYFLFNFFCSYLCFGRFYPNFIFQNTVWALTYFSLISDAFNTPSAITFTHLSVPAAADSSCHADNSSSSCISPLYCLKPLFGIIGACLIVCKHTAEVWAELCSWGKLLTDRNWESVTKYSSESINHREYSG